MKKMMMALMVVAILMASVVPAYALVGERGEYYPRLTVVVDKQESKRFADTWEITCRDKDGDEWVFYDDEGEWMVGDLCNLLMWKCGEHEYDDEIIEVYWEGFTEDVYGYRENMGW